MESSDDEILDIPTNMFVDVDRDMFVGRQECLDILETRLAEQKSVGLSGMGGAGKTTLTCLYAYINMKKYKNGVFFVDASNINTLPLNFAALAGPDLLDLVPNPEGDITTSIRLVSRWLQKNSDYLLIYDAADDIRILEELGKQRPTGPRYIPPKLKLRGHVIVSSRCPQEKFELVQIMQTLELEDLTPEDAHSLLWRRVYGETHRDEEESETLRIIANKFLPCRLPLFLEQTASYIRSENITFGEYLKITQKKKSQRSPIGAVSFGDNRQGLDERFVANFDAVHRRSPEAATLMGLAALCHSRSIPLSLFSFGSYVLHAHKECALDDDANNFVNHVISDMRNSDVNEEELYEFSKASEAGEMTLKQLVVIPWETQMLKFARGGREFSMHEVIQEQLRLRMAEQGKINSVLSVLGTVLLHMLKSDNVSLLNKRMFLEHADKCATHMVTFGTAPCTALYLRLRIKTAYAFAWMGSFTTAWDILEKVQSKIPEEGMESVHIELLSVKARICIWQHRANDALNLSQKGLGLAQYGEAIDMANMDEVREYALLRKSCAHALIMLNDPDQDKIHTHIDEGKRAFEHLIGKTKTSGREEHAILIMLHGQMHRNLAYKHQQDLEYSRQQYSKASKYLKEAYDVMDKESSTVDLCKIHLILVEVKLGAMPRSKAVEELGECREILERKLGRVHRYTAWVLEKTGQLLSEEADHEHALELLLESLEILKEVYGLEDGKVQIGGTMLLAGKSRLALGQTEAALTVFQEAQELLSYTPQHTAYKDVCSQIQMIRQMIEDGF